MFADAHISSLGYLWCKQIINEVTDQRLAILPFLFSRCPYLFVEVFVKVSIQSILVMNLEEDWRFLLYVFGCSISRFANTEMEA